MTTLKLLVTTSAALLSAQALAVGPLASDPAALAGWHSSQSFVSPSVNVNVDFAVFAPGAGGPASVPGEFIYAFQIFGNGQSLDRFGQQYILGAFPPHLTGVNPAYGMLGGATPVVNIPGLPVGPVSSQFSATFSPPLAATAYSSVFWYSAAQPPSQASCIFSNGTTFPIYSPGLAGPTPSAPTLAGVLLGGAVVLGRRKRVAS